MFLREPATDTLASITGQWKTRDREWTSDACVPSVDFAKGHQVEPTLSLGDHELTLDGEAIAQLCAFYSIPTAFFGRLTSREQHFVMNARIDHAEGEVTIAYNDMGITDVRKPTQPRLDVEEFIRIAHRLFPSSATVLDQWITHDDLRLDVIAPTPLPDFPGAAVYGGVRLAQNRKQNLAPTVSPILFHEPTTSVIQIPDHSLRIDGRGISIEKIAQRLAAEALRAEARLPKDAEHLANLMHTPIGGDRITRLHRVAAEHGLPVRPLADITVTLSRTDEPTMLDLVLAIANTANSPKLLTDPGKSAMRAKLQAIAGAVVIDEAERCDSCHATLIAA
jgi:hypothetical protein